MSTYTPKRSRRGMRLVIALALAGTAAGGVFVYTGSVQRQAAQQQSVPEAVTTAARTPKTSVVVAKTDLLAKTAVSADAFELRELAADAVAANALTSLDGLSGKVLSSAIAAGEQLTATRLLDVSADPKTIEDMIPAGLRAMSLNVSELTGAGGL